MIGRDLGVLLHAPAAPDLLDGVLDAAAVPVELARLRVELRLQLAEVESSRARIAQAGYEERRRLERDLHDGAQQRLVTLGIVLRRLQRSLPREAQMLVPALDAAVDEVAASIADLRTIAAGVRPPRLDEGLAAALADLARGAAIPVDVAATARPRARRGRGDGVLRRLRGAHQRGQARVADARGVETAREDGVLRMTIADDGVGGAVALPGMLDRVAAQGGTLAIDSPPGRGHADRRGAAMRIVIAEDTVLLREGLAGLLEDAGHEVVGKAGRRRHAADAGRRARAAARDRRRAHAARLRRRGHARGVDDPGHASRDGGARALPAHRDAPHRRAGDRGRRLRLPAQGPRARRRRLPRRRPPRRRRRLGAGPAGRGDADRRAAPGRARSTSSPRARPRCSG